MMVGPALSTRLPFEDEQATVLGASLDADGKAALIARLAADGAAFRRPGGGDAVDHAGLCQRQAGAAADDAARLCWRAPPRAGRSCPAASPASARPRDTTAIAMQRGGQAADVWVVSREPVERETLLPSEREGFTRNAAGQPAEPRRRQPDLARPLCRALGRHRAHPARLSRAPRRDLRPGPAAARRHARLSRAARHRRRSGDPARPGLDHRPRRLQRRPDPRPLLARWLAGAARPVEDRPQIRRPRWRRATTRPAP